MIECSISHQFDYSHGVQSNCFARVGQRTDGIWGFDVRLWNSKYFLHYRLDYVRRFGIWVGVWVVSSNFFE